MKRFVLASFLVALAALVWLLAELRPVASGGAPQFVHVERGSGFSKLARDLEERGLIRNARVLSLVARATGRARSVKAGRYRLSPSSGSLAILGGLVSGETYPVRVVFPEGIWLPEVARLIGDSLNVATDSVLTAASDPALLAAFDIPAESAEGYLFPDTYEFEGNESASEAVARLVSAATRRFGPDRQARAQALGLSRHEVLTLASIIEAETAVPAERGRVSAVYHRRLRRGMMLQADPTIVYALGTRGRAPRYKDLDLDSPYNTYRRKGLPPGPIGSPGDASIHAALHPDSTCTALFFVARADGSHIFTDTFEEHVAARRGLTR